MKKQTLLLMLALLLSISGYAQKTTLDVSITNQVVPALLRNQDNNVLCINIKNPGDRELTLSAITLSLKGTDNLERHSIPAAIRHRRLFVFPSGCGVRKNSRACGFGDFQRTANFITRNNYFWASVTPLPPQPDY